MAVTLRRPLQHSRWPGRFHPGRVQRNFPYVGVPLVHRNHKLPRISRHPRPQRQPAQLPIRFVGRHRPLLLVPLEDLSHIPKQELLVVHQPHRRPRIQPGSIHRNRIALRSHARVQRLKHHLPIARRQVSHKRQKLPVPRKRRRGVAYSLRIRRGQRLHCPRRHREQKQPVLLARARLPAVHNRPPVRTPTQNRMLAEIEIRADPRKLVQHPLRSSQWGNHNDLREHSLPPHKRNLAPVRDHAGKVSAAGSVVNRSGSCAPGLTT